MTFDLNLNYNDIRLLMDGYDTEKPLVFLDGNDYRDLKPWLERKVMEEIGIDVVASLRPSHGRMAVGEGWFWFTFTCGEDRLAFQLQYII